MHEQNCKHAGNQKRMQADLVFCCRCLCTHPCIWHTGVHRGRLHKLYLNRSGQARCSLSCSQGPSHWCTLECIRDGCSPGDSGSGSNAQFAFCRCADCSLTGTKTQNHKPALRLAAEAQRVAHGWSTPYVLLCPVMPAALANISTQHSTIRKVSMRLNIT